ncbi:hypothetical protein BGZ81_011368 [Podila clonocystis]|nr:hypothetical protein BGZ81_011368 [Podila clonocystis]
MSSPQEKSKHSVLVMGITQAGKSTLIEHIRSYAHPGYAIDESLLGDGIVSKTESTTPFFVESNFPAYEVYRNDTGEVVDLSNITNVHQKEDDYQDLLLSHPDNVTMRLALKDPKAPSELMEFQFLDTPGLNGTHGKDNEYAASIVEELIRTRSFSLIIFVISSKNPLTEERQLALEYFAYVLRGLHSRIVFLHSHVDYSELHHSNTTHFFDMKLKNQFLSNIFRRHAGDVIYDEEKIEEYPNLSIDLITRNRPIIQCLIRNTIRQILLMATAHPLTLDTSSKNIERIRTIAYPIDVDQERRKMFENTLKEDRQRAMEAQRRSHQKELKHSVLVIGTTQSGKSAFIQHIKNYANPSYAIDQSLLGNGNLTKTESTRPFFVESNLPVYEVFHKATGDIIDLKDLASKSDEEDYRDILSSREKNVGLRLAPSDSNAPSDLVEFRFLDTPGLNDTSDRDSSHAVNIISEMINTGSFNLIIIVVSFKNHINEEQQLALEYYADVFKGLHTRIMFLHTHVDYTDVHHTNTVHYLDMKMKNKVLSKIFRRFDSETAFDEDYIKEYPSFTIDLVSKKRPVINCLIRNTIRDILKMATDPAVLLDTSMQNIERIRAITHPSKFNDDERKKVKARFAAEAMRHEIPDMDHQINILLLGDVQSGKTSLVDMFQLYSDPTFIVNTHNLTQNQDRVADEKVKFTSILAGHHTVEIRKLRGSSEYVVIDLEEEAKRLGQEDFEDLLNLDQTEAETVNIAPDQSKTYRINIYEGPGLNACSETFEKNIFSIYRAIVDSGQKFHQVLLALAPGPIATEIVATIAVCFEIFFDLSSLFSLVYTKVDCSKLHNGNKEFQASLKEGQERIKNKVQSMPPWYLIDCDIQSNYPPVQRARTMNVIHHILIAASKKKPIALTSPMMKKTPRIVSIDTRLKCQSRESFQHSQKEIVQNDKHRLKLRSQINSLSKEYKDMDQVVDSTKNTKDFASRDEMEVIFEDIFTAAAEPYPEIYSKTMTFKKQSRLIKEVQMVYENVEIEQALGGEGFNHWKIIYRRTSGAAASLVVKLYAKKQDSAGNPIGETEDMAANRLQRAQLNAEQEIAEAKAKALARQKKEYYLLRYCILRETLPNVIMERLISTGNDVTNGPPLDIFKEVYLDSESVFGDDPYSDIEESDSMDTDDGMDAEYFNDALEKYSILMFGKTQAGKSTFVEFVKNYADPQYTIDENLIGSGFKSKTGRPVQFAVRSDLSAYEVFDKSGNRIDIDALGYQSQNSDDYLDTLKDRKAVMKPVTRGPEAPLSRRVKISFLDTPGIEDTGGKDTEHAPRIIHEMAKMRTFNLIIIIVNCKDISSKAHQLAFDYYSKVIQVLQGHHDNIVFVYTHVEYEQCHQSNVNFQKQMKIRHTAFSHLFRGIQGSFNSAEIQGKAIDLFPMYTIDFDKGHRPIPRCMRLRTLRKILQRAVEAPPVPLDTIMKNLLRVYGIDHPDELNKEQKSRIVDTPQAILERREECNDDMVAASSDARTEHDHSKIVGEEDPGSDDCEGYLPHWDPSARYITEDEDDGGIEE